MTNKKIIIEKSWHKLLNKEFNKKYFSDLREKVRQSYTNSKVFPPAKLIFNAFNLTSVPNTKVIILGQDPYFNEGQAHGLSFSVPNGVIIPPSLLNIYKEIESDLGKSIPNNGFLGRWANQGVLLLNTVLTVESGKPNSHKSFGWEQFTESVIKRISLKKSNLVFMLWGGNAHKKEHLINSNNHLILKSPHPSPLSAYRGFFGCKHFSKCNKYLKKNNIKEIIW
tara:strand:+ start:2949 stop:3620 length:672 start_codon:yes stop_codon:yes gene_type:complete